MTTPPDTTPSLLQITAKRLEDYVLLRRRYPKVQPDVDDDLTYAAETGAKACRIVQRLAEMDMDFGCPFCTVTRDEDGVRHHDDPDCLWLLARQMNEP